MINVSFGPNIFLGIIVSVGVLILYSLRNVKPEIARDEDIFFSTIGGFPIDYQYGTVP